MTRWRWWRLGGWRRPFAPRAVLDEFDREIDRRARAVGAAFELERLYGG